MNYTARWTPLGGRWSLAVTDGRQKVVAFARTDVRASHERPGGEYLLDAGFALFPGGRWREEPGGFWCPVMPLVRARASGFVRDGLPGD